MHDPHVPGEPMLALPTAGAGELDATVLICTCNRADHLSKTLESLADCVAGMRCEVIVVDNNSTDRTRAVVEEWAARYPVPLRGLFEPQQGKSMAMNTGIAAARGRIIAFTDDDVKVRQDWLRRMVEGMDRHQCAYAGGRVIPMWEKEPPEWFPRTNTVLSGVVAILDYGPDAMEFGRRVPLGVNMAIRRQAFERVGGFDTRLGRKAGTLLGQAEREWFLRARAAGLSGYYLPDVELQHWVPANRLTKEYFRRWFYWRGIARAMLYAQNGLDMERPESSQLNFRDVPHLAGVPRYLYRTALQAAYAMVKEKVRGRSAESFEQELWLWNFAGIVKQRWTDRHVLPGTLGTVNPDSAPVAAPHA